MVKERDFRIAKVCMPGLEKTDRRRFFFFCVMTNEFHTYEVLSLWLQLNVSTGFEECPERGKETLKGKMFFPENQTPQSNPTVLRTIRLHPLLNPSTSPSTP
jgi:hypothetical protein